MATGGNMVKLVVQLLADVQDFAGELKGATAAVEKMAAEAGQELAGVSNEVATAMDAAAGEISAGMTEASADVGTMADSIESEMKEVATEIGAAGDAMASELGEGAKAAGDKIEQEIEEGAAEAAKAIDQIPEKSQGAWGKMTGAAGAAGNKISTGMKKMAGDTSMSFREATNKVAEDVSGMATKIGTTMMAAGGAILGALALAANASREVTNVLGELSTAGVGDLEAVKEAGMRFSNQWAGISTPDFINAAGAIKAAVAQLSDEAVISFTEAATLTAKATKSTGDEMADLFGKAYAIFKPLAAEMSDVEWAQRFGGAMTAAANAFNTSGSEMASAIRSVGAAASTAKVPLEEQLAILGTLQATMSGAEAGTLYKSFLTRAAMAGKELNLQFINANGTLKSTPEILTLIQKKFPDISQAAAQVELKKAFGEEGTKLIMQMIPQMGLLQEGIENVGKGWQRAGEETAESAEKMNTDKLALAAQQFENLRIQIGDLVVAALGPFLVKITSLIQHAQDWVANNKPLVDILIKVAAVIGVVLVAVGALLLVFAAAAAAVALFTSAAAATVGAGIAAIFTATGAIVAGIVAAVIGAAVLVIKYWTEIKIFFGYLWDGIKEVFAAAWYYIGETIKGAWKNIVDLFTRNWQLLKDILETAWDFMTAGWELAKDGPTRLAEWLVNSIKAAVDKCKNFLRELWADIKNLPGELWGGVKDFFGGGGDAPAAAGAGTNAMRAPGAAGAARLPTAGGSTNAMMGAAGAASAAAGAAGAGGQVTNVNEINLYQQPGQSPEELLKAMARELNFRRGGRA